MYLILFTFKLITHFCMPNAKYRKHIHNSEINIMKNVLHNTMDTLENNNNKLKFARKTTKNNKDLQFNLSSK
jgi:hypothetical protein